MSQEPEKKNYSMSMEVDLLEAGKAEAKRQRKSFTQLLREFLQEIQENAEA